MIDGQNHKYSLLLYPQSVATNATATATVDTLGFDHCQIYVTNGVEATNPTVLKVSEGTNTSASTDIAAFTGDGGSGFTIAAADTDNGTSTLLDLPQLGARERYLKIHVTPGATGLVSAVAILSKAKIGASTAALKGVDVYQTSTAS